MKTPSSYMEECVREVILNGLLDDPIIQQNTFFPLDW